MKDQTLVSFGERIKKIRNALGLSQKEFAQSINIPNSSMSEFESGRTRPTFYFFHNISRVHHVNLKYLFHGEGNMFDRNEHSKSKDGIFMDEETREMIDNLRIPAVRLSMMAEYNRVKKIFKPLIDEFNEEGKNLKENSL